MRDAIPRSAPSPYPISIHHQHEQKQQHPKYSRSSTTGLDCTIYPHISISPACTIIMASSQQRLFPPLSLDYNLLRSPTCTIYRIFEARAVALCLGTDFFRFYPLAPKYQIYISLLALTGSPSVSIPLSAVLKSCATRRVVGVSVCVCLKVSSHPNPSVAHSKCRCSTDSSISTSYTFGGGGQGVLLVVLKMHDGRFRIAQILHRICRHCRRINAIYNLNWKISLKESQTDCLLIRKLFSNIC